MDMATRKLATLIANTHEIVREIKANKSNWMGKLKVTDIVRNLVM